MDVKIYPSKLEGKTLAISSGAMAHRAFIAAMLADGAVISAGDIASDVRVTERCLNSLGYTTEKNNGAYSVCPDSEKETSLLDFEDSAATLKLILPSVFALGKAKTLTGKEKLLKTLRYQADNLKGCVFYNNGFPARIGGRLAAGEYVIKDGKASQFASGLLMALPLAEGDSKVIIEPEGAAERYLDMTVKLTGKFGIETEKTEYGYFIRGGQKYRAPELLEVEGDYTNAAYFMAANTFGNDVTVAGLSENSFQPDSNVKELISALNKKNSVLDLKFNSELAPALAVAACYKTGDTTIKNLQRIKLKETDRIKVLAIDINKIGGNAEETEDGIIVHGAGRLKGGAIVDCFGDKRIAMAMTIAGTMAEEPVTILSVQSVNKVYPNFFNVFMRLGGKCSVI